MRSLPLFLLCFTAISIRAQHSPPGGFITAPYGPNGTWNLYQVCKERLTWLKAQKLAAATTDPLGGSGKAGHLPAISSAAENMFVYHYMLGETLWIGLTDNEQFKGAQEAGSMPHKGWVWVNGEPVTWTNWASTEPTEWNGEGSKGEDAVAIERIGLWNDRPNGGDGQTEESYGFMIEWDVESPEPVKGARVIGPVLPAKWPELDAMPEAKDGPWLCVPTHAGNGGADVRMEELLESFVAGWNEEPPFRLANLNVRIERSANDTAFGWIFNQHEFPVAEAGGFAMLCRARLRVPKAGTYTFNVHADDGFALRLPGQKWKAVHGAGGIDPLDLSTIYNSLLGPDGDTRGVVELPAGELPVEVLYFNSLYNAAIQIMTAEGEHAQDGSTDRWRLFDHRAGGKIHWPGVDEAGWKLTLPPPGKERLNNNGALTPADFARLADSSEVRTFPGLDAINFHDPHSAARGRFPGAKPYPEDPDGPQDDRLVIAEATLVIPADGTWHIGMCGDERAALQIEGQKWNRIVLNAAAGSSRIEGDSISSWGTIMNCSQALAGEIRLAKGTYPLRIFSFDNNGPSTVQVFAAPAGYPARLLIKGGAVTEDDLPGMEVVPGDGK